MHEHYRDAMIAPSNRSLTNSAERIKCSFVHNLNFCPNLKSSPSCDNMAQGGFFLLNYKSQEDFLWQNLQVKV